MTRRERLQLMRTTTDLFRLVPFLVIALIPFMEFLLPVILKVFPNLLPSTFLEKSEKDNRIKQELQTRLAVAEFFQTAMTSLAKQQNKRDKDGSAQELLQFIEKSRTNETIPNEQVMRMARLFNDELTLPNLSESQLRALCKYMGLPLYGNAAILRYQIRSKLRNIIEDDKRIIYEGVDSLTTTELAEACKHERYCICTLWNIYCTFSVIMHYMRLCMIHAILSLCYRSLFIQVEREACVDMVSLHFI